VLANDKLIFALPKGRILRDVMSLVNKVGIEPEAAFEDGDDRRLRFATNDPNIDIIRVRSIDMGTILSFGAAHFGIAGADVLTELDSREIYAPLDLKVGLCRMVVAEPIDLAGQDNPTRWSQIRVATKYPQITRRHFASRGVQAECIKLHGAIEIAPSLGLCRRIVDLVSTGETLRANGLVEVEQISVITSRLAINRTAMKTRPVEMTAWIDRFRGAVDDAYS
ncbi:uncharacterized protein METZ01_LOCUS153732, partial [marine metagenome]